MAIMTLTNSKIWVGGYDLSGDLNQINLDYNVKLNDGTTFGSGGTVINVPGMPTFTFTGNGFWQALDPAVLPSVDPTLWANLGLSNVPMCVGPQTGAVGETCYFSQNVQATYHTGAKVGDLFAIDFDGHSVGNPLIQGTIIENGTKTSSWNGTASQLGAVLITQKVYAELQVFTVAGTLPTLDLLIQSASDNVFTTPHTRITFTQAVAAGAQYKSLVGAVTDQFWRVSATVAGTLPSFIYAVAVGIR